MKEITRFEYADAGVPISDFHAEEWILERMKEKGHHFFCTENVFSETRRLLAEGKILCDEVEFYFKGVAIPLSRFGTFLSDNSTKIPDGFCDMMQKSVMACSTAKRVWRERDYPVIETSYGTFTIIDKTK